MFGPLHVGEPRDAKAVADAMNFLRDYARGDRQASESPSPDFSSRPTRGVR